MKGKILLYNLVVAAAVAAIMYIVIPRSFWSSEIMPNTIWLIVAMQLVIVLAVALKAGIHFSALVSGAMLYCIGMCLIIGYAPNLARELHLAAGIKVSFITYVALAFMCVGSFMAWRYAARTWPVPSKVNVRRRPCRGPYID